MGDNLAIKVEGLGKRYQIGEKQERYQTLRDVLVKSVKRLTVNRSRKIETSTIWALKDISVEINHGDVVGIIGGNGAGKSTLLKILSHITEPTAGRVTLYGRVGSLLEVGTGFHPELTGRDNIYLNGAILGMKKAEIERKFDEIVDFAEIEKFLDTPAKRYSSGMYVRLAFAVAAHLDPEILLVDEVLAVGDAQFQKKCLGKMSSIANTGRTILFVSHNMAVIQKLCTKTILLQKGKLLLDGATQDVISSYLKLLQPNNVQGDEWLKDLSDHPGRDLDKKPIIKKAWLQNLNGEPCSTIQMGEGIRICFSFESDTPIFGPGFGIGIDGMIGDRVFTINNHMAPIPGLSDSVQKGTVVCEFESLPLLPNTYYITFYLGEHRLRLVDHIERALGFTVVESDIFGTGVIPNRSNGDGVIYKSAKFSYIVED